MKKAIASDNCLLAREVFTACDKMNLTENEFRPILEQVLRQHDVNIRNQKEI